MIVATNIYATIAFMAVVAIAAVIDLRVRRIPNWLTYPAILVAVALAAYQGMLGQALIGGLAGAGLFILPILLYGTKGAGGGDVKLAAFIGCVLGLSGTLMAMLIAGLAASGVLLVGLATRRVSRRTPVPFGPFLALGALLAVLI